MANDGQIVFEVTADGKHAIADIKEITRAIKQETGKWDDAAKQSTDGIASQFSGMLKKITAGFTVAKVGQALLNLGKDAIAAASDLAEVQNVVDVTFGENANQINKWAKNAGAQFGLTETQAKRFSSTIGAMMKSSGVAGQEILGMSTNLAGLAADMASFYNLDFETAFEKIRSGISGETEPLKQLGINMSVANLEAFAMTQGLDKAFSKMSQGEQTMLRYQYLMQATSDAQGDFARTSDGYANSMRKLETNVEQLKTTLGASFIGVVAEATGYINEFVELLTPDESKRTVLDDFSEIDMKTDEKLASIRATAEEARALTEQLDAIGGSKSDKAGAQVQKIVSGLSEINLDQGKTGVVTDFISTLAENIDVLAAIQGTDAEGAQAWLEGIADSANKLDPEDAAGWATLIESIKTGLPGLENTEFGASFFAALGEGFTDVEGKASVLEWVVDTLGNKTSRTAEEQELWLETCKRLVKTIPGLSSIINTETGEINGGTQAVKDYIKAWEDGETKIALLNAQAARREALNQKYSDLPGLQVDAMLAKNRMDKAFEQLQKYANDYKIDLDWYDENFTTFDSAAMRKWGLTPDQYKVMKTEVDYYVQLKKEAEAAQKEYDKQNDAYKEAKKIIEDGEKAIEEMGGAYENTASAAEEFWTKNEDNIKATVSATDEALKSLNEYVDGVKKAAVEAVNSVAHGLNGITFSRYSKEDQDRVTELTQALAGEKVGSDKWKEINAEIQEINKGLITQTTIWENMESQIAFLDSYLENLKAAKDMGLDANLLAELSDGSVESAQYLDALVNDKGGKTVEEINAKYREIQEKKGALASELANQQLTVDQTYQALAEKAKEAVAALDLQAEAAQNAGNTTQGIADGIKSHIPDVAAQVDSILSELERLNGFNVNIDFGGFGSINFTTSTGKTEGSARFGMTVPHDDYIARLHEGERVLTAQENQIWNALRNGGISGFDLETLGGVMRDNVKPGGNVYLDGRVVGSVISEQQGKSYRQLQRSGWQG